MIDPELGAVKADPGQIDQVILNLVVNARDAMPQGGKLTIELYNTELDETYALGHPEARQGPHVLLAVTDTGCGMDQATMTRLFEPFFSTKGRKARDSGWRRFMASSSRAAATLPSTARWDRELRLRSICRAWSSAGP